MINQGRDWFQSIRDAMEKDKGRITGELNAVFGHKPEAAVIGDMEGDALEPFNCKLWWVLIAVFVV